MTMILDGSSGVTFPNSTVQASSGVVLQVVNATYSTQVTTTSASFVTTNLTASITPKFSNSKILVIVNLCAAYISVASTGSGYTIYRNSSNLITSGAGVHAALAEAYSGATGLITSPSMIFLDSPATTSSTSYTSYFGSFTAGNSTAINQNVGDTSVITLMEIAA